MAVDWSNRYARRASHVSVSAIREILKLTQRPGIISLAGGLPCAEMFPLQAAQEAACRVLGEQGERVLQYGITEGYAPLRGFVADRISQSGVKVAESNILITSGSQQGLDLISRLFVNPGDSIVVECPTFLGALQTFNSYQARYVGVDTDSNGMVTSHLEEVIGGDVKFMYVQPNFQNPGGTTLSLERRHKVVEIANAYGFPIVEDDPYHEFRFSGDHMPSLLATDARNKGAGGDGDGLQEGNVIRLGTFSKTLAPGLRLGWVVANSEVIRQLVVAKQATDLHTSTFTQALAFEILKDGFLGPHVLRLCEIYGERCRAMLSAIDRYFPEGIRWTVPQGGFFIWVTLVEDLDATALLQEAVDEGVAFVPGVAFFPDDGRPPGHNTLRLSFSFCEPSVIEEGIRRLGRVISRHVD